MANPTSSKNMREALMRDKFDPDNYTKDELRALIAEADAVVSRSRAPFIGPGPTRASDFEIGDPVYMSRVRAVAMQARVRAENAERDRELTLAASKATREAPDPATFYWDPEDVDCL